MLEGWKLYVFCKADKESKIQRNEKEEHRIVSTEKTRTIPSVAGPGRVNRSIDRQRVSKYNMLLYIMLNSLAVKTEKSYT
jgi:hypothetical protein